MIKGIVNQLETLVLVTSPTGLLETEWSLNWLVSHLLALTSEVLSVSLDTLNQIHSVIETGDGESWLCVFAKAQLLPAAKRSLALPFRHKTHATSVTREEGRKLLLMNGAAVFLAAFLAFGIYQGVTAESYIDADEIYYAYYMKHISGPWSEESRDWLKEQRNEFAPMLEVQKRVNRGELSSEARIWTSC